MSQENPTLRERSVYIPLDQCEDRGIYKIHCRNLGYAVYNQTKKGFIGIRNKFNRRFLDTEYHWDADPTYGTAKPLEKVGVLPGHILPIESLPCMMDYVTAREVEWKEEYPEVGKGWYYFVDNGIRCPEGELCKPAMVNNFELFHYIEQIDKEHGRVD